MFLTLFCFSFLLSVGHGFVHYEQFITHVLNMQDSNNCVLDLVSDGERSAISAEFIENIEERWVLLPKGGYKIEQIFIHKLF